MTSEQRQGQFEPKPHIAVSRIPAWQILFRGFSLLILAFLIVGVVVFLATVSIWLALIATPIVAPVVFLAAWGAAVQLSGGEKFDDHPWV